MTSSSFVRLPLYEKMSGKCAKIAFALEEMSQENSEQNILRGAMLEIETATTS